MVEQKIIVNVGVNFIIRMSTCIMILNLYRCRSKCNKFQTNYFSPNFYNYIYNIFYRYVHTVSDVRKYFESNFV